MPRQIFSSTGLGRMAPEQVRVMEAERLSGAQKEGSTVGLHFPLISPSSLFDLQVPPWVSFSSYPGFSHLVEHSKELLSR